MKQCWKKIRICVPQILGLATLTANISGIFISIFESQDSFELIRTCIFQNCPWKKIRPKKFSYCLGQTRTGTFFWSPCTWSFPFESFSQTIIDKAGKQFCDDYFNLFLPTLHDRDKWSISLCSKGSSEGCWQRSWQVCWGFGYLRREHWQIGSSHTFYLILQAFFILIYKF